MDSKSLWENLKKGVETGIKTITEKTEELTEMGRLKLEILSTKREIEKYFIELGGRIYQFMKENAAGDVSKNTEIQALVEKIRTEEKKLEELNTRYDKIKKDTREGPEVKSQEPGNTNL
jgi:predicted RNase H-like nuclease (RuvC/YqgF family)